MKNVRTKAVSLILSTLLAVNAGWTLLAVNVSANTPFVSYTGSVLSVNNELEDNETGGFQDFDVTNDGGLKITYYHDGSNVDHSIVQNLIFMVGSNCTLCFYTDYTTSSLALNGGSGSSNSATIKVQSDVYINGSISGMGDNEILNYGRVHMDSFNSVYLRGNGLMTFSNGATFPSGEIAGTGTLIADSVTIANDCYSDVEGSVIEVTDSFTKDNRNINAVVKAEPDTEIVSTGGSFTLQVGDCVKKITGAVNDEAINLMDDPEIDFNSTFSSYYGVEYDFSSRVSTADGYDGTIYFEYSSSPDSGFSRTKPTAVGKYYVLAYAPASSSYREAVSELMDYQILYLPLALVSGTGNYCTLEGVVNGIYVPDKVKVVPMSGYKIACTAEGDEFADYVELDRDDVQDDEGTLRDDLKFALSRNSDGATTEYSAASIIAPRLAGLVFDEYEPEIYGVSADRLEASLEDNETIVADELTFSVYDENLASVTVDGKTYTEDDGIEEGNVDITLRSVVAEPREITVTAVDKAGKETSVSFTLRHTPVDVDATVYVPDTYVGEDYNPVVTTDSDGDVSFTYGEEGVNAVYLDKPTWAGNFTVTASIAATENYNATSCTGAFKIIKRTPSASVSVPDSIIDEGFTPVLTTDSDGKRDAVFEYKPANAPDNAYTTTKPNAKGTYTVRATIPETDRYFGRICTSTFTIKVKPVTATVAVTDPLAGTSFDPVITTDSDGKDKTVFEYRPAGAADTAFTTDKPTEVGSYVVRATVPETAVYGKVVCTSEFKISYLAAPDKAYDMAGTAGDNDFFTSDVELKAPDGYTISTSFNGEYRASVPYTDTLNAVYLKRTSDGALTSAIAIEIRPKIDKEMPSITDPAGSLTDGSVKYVKDLAVTVSDDNLLSLTINGVSVDLENAGNVVTLSPGNGIKVFKILAVDQAGNKSAVEITLMAEWLKDKIIPADLLLPLEAGEGYNLSGGKWTVTGVNGEDGTVYNGGIPIYVNDSGDYTFTQVG
ncbi:hypothetical protein SAMN02910456_02688 [Ruminococcaceae bacterium YRB3002]|nr:hypothetical protein SAMN02910456_02688 [Ruminococcaceae bacterium YRB3002]